MIPSLSQETITEYASEAQTIQEPQGTDYSQGVRVGRTVPAKWWNWLFRGATRRLRQARADAQDMLTEMQNVVTDAGLTLDGSDSTQLTQAVSIVTDNQIEEFITDKKGLFVKWQPAGAPLTSFSRYNSWMWDDDCCVSLPFESGDWGFEIRATNNYISWVTLRETHGNTTDSAGVIITKFAGKCFILSTHTRPNDTYASTGCRLYTFDGAQLQRIGDWYGVPGGSYNLGSLVPIMFVTEQRLGIISFEGSYQSTSNPFSLHVHSTVDGENWTDKVYSVPSYYNRVASAASRPVRGYEFPDGVVVGNALIGPDSITRLSAINFTNWYPRTATSVTSMVEQLGSNLVFKGDDNKIYTSPISGNAPVLTEHTIAGISSYSIYCTLHNGNILIIRDNNGHYQFSTDGYTFTDTGATSIIFELNGTYFSGRKKSTDLINWVDVHVDPQYTFFNICNVIEAAGAVVAQSNRQFLVSFDLGDTWIESSVELRSVSSPYPAISTPGVPNIGDVFFMVTSQYSSSSSQSTMQSYATANATNSVIGHTLYLR